MFLPDRHKKWRYALKKLRRKELRTLEAQAREHEIIQQSDEDETQDVNDVNRYNAKYLATQVHLQCFCCVYSNLAEIFTHILDTQATVANS